MTTDPAVPEPDDKDWTWVLDRPCPDCGYQAGTPRDRIGALIHENIGRWLRVLDRDTVAERPSPEVWSPLEYGAHVRDVYLMFGGRLQRLLTEDDPEFENWDQDATALEKRYWEADPRSVSAELATAGEVLAAMFDRVGADEWQRPGRRSNGSVFTVETLGWYALHDDIHHLHDVAG